MATRFFCMIAAVTMIISACTSVRHIPIEQKAIAKLAGKETIVVKRPMPSFNMWLSSKTGIATTLLGGLVGGAVAGAKAARAGNSLIQENSIPNPAYEIAEELAKSMQEKYGIQYIGIGRKIVSDDEISSIVTAYKAVPLALDVKTLGWSITYSPLHWTKYIVFYSALLRLIDTGSSAIVVEGGCDFKSAGTDDAPTYDELFMNHASRLKAELRKAARHCIQQLSSQYLGL